MKRFTSLRRALLPALASMAIAGFAYAGLWNFPFASLTSSQGNAITLPMTGQECLPGDTNLSGGRSPQTACYTQGNIKGNYVASLTDGATIAWDASSNAQIYKVTLGGARTLAFPTGITTGQTGSLLIVQDATGSRTLTWPSATSFAAASGGANTPPTLTTTGGRADLFQFYYTGTQLDINGASSQNRVP